MPLFGRNRRDTSHMIIWGPEEFAEYMRANVKFGGNSKKFEAIREGLEAFREASREPDENSRTMSMARANDRLLKACEVYMQDREGAKTSSGQERLDVARLLYKRQKELGLESQTLSVSEYTSFLDASKGVGDSELFKEVRAKAKGVSALFDKPITEETRKEMQEAREALAKACQDYIEARSGAKSQKGRDRLYAVRGLLERQEKDLGGHLENQTKTGGMAEYEGMTWGQADRMKAAQMASRIAVTQSGLQMEAQKKIIQAMGAQKVSIESAKEMTKADTAYLRACETWMKNIPQPSTAEEREEYQRVSQEYDAQKGRNLSQLRDVNILKTYEGKTWESVNHVPVAEARLTGAKETVGDAASERIKVEYNGAPGFFTQSKPVLRPEEEFDSYVNSLDDPYMRSLLGKYRNVLMIYDGEETKNAQGLEVRSLLYNNRNNEDYRETAFEGIKKRLRDQGIKDEEILENDKAINHCVNMLEHVSKTIVIQKGDISFGTQEVKAPGLRVSGPPVEYGDDFAKRNAATTRVADYLGVGHLVARSEFMNLQIDGKVVSGSFMEFAQGTDLRSKNPEDIKKLKSVNSLSTPGFYKDTCDLSMLDFLCGQIDRHSGNMFYKLGEVDGKGNRAVVGIQGIDNDQAFLETTGNVKGGQLYLEGMMLLSEELKEKIMDMDRSDLDYMLGDILKKEEIDAAEFRLERAKGHIEKNMAAIGKDGWDLDKYDGNNPKLNAEEKALADKVNLYLKTGRERKFPWSKDQQYIHTVKSGFAKLGAETFVKESENLAHPKPKGVAAPAQEKENKPAAPARKMDWKDLSTEARPVREGKALIGAHRAAKAAPVKDQKEPVKAGPGMH